MSCSLLFTLAAFLVAGYFVSVARGSEAKILLESVDNNTIYELNQDILEKVSQLQAPIRVVAAIGSARVGKSTTLNLISHIWPFSYLNFRFSHSMEWEKRKFNCRRDF